MLAIKGHRSVSKVKDRREGERSARRRSIASLAVSGLLLATAGFIYGVAMMYLHVFPYAILREMKDAVSESAIEFENWKMYLEIRPTEHLHPARREGRGVVVNEGSAVAPGLTLLSGLFDDNGSTVRLIDNDGNVVENWLIRYSDIWPEPNHVLRAPFNDWFTDVHGAILLPDRSIVFNFEYLGLSRVDRCGNVMWKLARETHHTVFLADDGTMWVPARRNHEAPSTAFPGVPAPFHEDTVLQVTLDGQVIREISMLGLIYGNKMEGLLQTNFMPGKMSYNDPLHLNDVDVLPAGQGAAFDMFEPGVVMASMRAPNLVLVFDPDTGEILWHQTGPWLRQHDPDFRADGLISIFDNRNSPGNGDILGGSRILLVDPASRRAWEAYPHTEGNRFFTSVRGKHQNLPNGDVLVVESRGGRVLEVAKDGKIVWTYLNRYDESAVGTLQGASRYPETYLDPVVKDCVAAE